MLGLHTLYLGVEVDLIAKSVFFFFLMLISHLINFAKWLSRVFFFFHYFCLQKLMDFISPVISNNSIESLLFVVLISVKLFLLSPNVLSVIIARVVSSQSFFPFEISTFRGYTSRHPVDLNSDSIYRKKKKKRKLMGKTTYSE